jgi:hypothetical protein
MGEESTVHDETGNSLGRDEETFGWGKSALFTMKLGTALVEMTKFLR